MSRSTVTIFFSIAFLMFGLVGGLIPMFGPVAMGIFVTRVATDFISTRAEVGIKYAAPCWIISAAVGVSLLAYRVGGVDLLIFQIVAFCFTVGGTFLFYFPRIKKEALKSS